MKAEPTANADCIAGADHTAARDVEAFSVFYGNEHDGQVRRAFLLLGRAGAAHDVVADAFIEVYRRWETLENPGPYLNRCVLNGCRDGHRRHGRERLVDHFEPEPEPESDPDRPMGEMTEALLGLPFRQRAAIVLRYYGGFSEAEIGRQLNCRPGTVGSLIHRGLKTMRKTLSKEAEHG